jgi:hypothetical protein
MQEHSSHTAPKRVTRRISKYFITKQVSEGGLRAVSGVDHFESTSKRRHWEVFAGALSPPPVRHHREQLTSVQQRRIFTIHYHYNHRISAPNIDYFDFE